MALTKKPAENTIDVISPLTKYEKIGFYPSKLSKNSKSEVLKEKIDKIPNSPSIAMWAKDCTGFNQTWRNPWGNTAVVCTVFERDENPEMTSPSKKR